MEKLQAIILGLVIAVGAAVGIGYYSVTGTETCTVVSKDRTSAAKGGSDMRIYTQDCGVLVVTDSLLDGQWSSADVYQSIEIGRRYQFNTRGVRVPFLSMFPNIVRVTPAG